MSAQIPKIGQQMTIPGVETNCPPKTYDEAVEWLRANCKVSQHWNEDIDIVKIQLNVDTPNGDGRKFYSELEIFPNDLKGSSIHLIREAQEAYEFKRKIENGERFAS